MKKYLKRKRNRYRIKKIFSALLITVIAIIIVTLIILYIYRPAFSVKYKGEFLGYSTDILNIKEKINEALTNGNDEASFFDLEEPIEYEIAFLKRRYQPNEEEILVDIVNKAIPKYKYYILYEGNRPKYNFLTYSSADEVIKELRKKKSKNANDLKIEVQYKEEILEEDNKITAVGELFEKPVIRTTGHYMESRGMTTQHVAIPIELQAPLKGVVTSGFQTARRLFGYPEPHTGTDIGKAIGYPIKASQDGIVIYAGYTSSGYGNMVVIDHGEGVHTRYAHCNTTRVKKGQIVEQGQLIGTVGNTGRSTGPHLHYEIRYYGLALNPTYYVSFR